MRALKKNPADAIALLEGLNKVGLSEFIEEELKDGQRPPRQNPASNRAGNVRNLPSPKPRP